MWGLELFRRVEHLATLLVGSAAMLPVLTVVIVIRFTGVGIMTWDCDGIWGHVDTP